MTQNHAVRIALQRARFSGANVHSSRNDRDASLWRSCKRGSFVNVTNYEIGQIQDDNEEPKLDFMHTGTPYVSAQGRKAV